ncbi:prephenate dehydrogenase [Marinoscillum furvescens]|uniref:Prephenate dehydrogenase n=1 Tax=Marinoscillum furvescens DSM 4134 TaxID=1122208 RepID=A0A3D9KYW0_MARFU|nr:prephenate dehydrogenase [Marinoscillum furvescens]RED93163.1 prephenate dehydrogenase [Marinoscillum furvescens DSM 4134]
MKVLFIGTGLIGGSFSLAMRKHGLLTAAGGYSRNPKNLDKSIALGIIDQKFDTMEAGIAWADWIILSIPVDAIVKLLPGILDQLKPGQGVIDFGSTKGTICDAVATHPNRSQFLAAHPIAGTEYSGPDAAFDTLFDGKLMILCNENETDAALTSSFRMASEKIGMQLESMEAHAHDRHLAYISHLSHITSFALSNAVLEKEKDGDIILELAGSGFASTVRLAKSSPEMWAPIFMENKDKVLEALDDFLDQAQAFRTMLKENRSDEVLKFLEQGRLIKKVID